MDKEEFEKRQQDLSCEVLEDIFDCDLKQLRDLHLAYVLRKHMSSCNSSKLDLTDNFINEHKELLKRIKSI